MSEDIYESSLRSSGDLGAVFEYDGETAYFYMFDDRQPDGHKVIDFIHITSKPLDFKQRDVRIRWNASETQVGLVIGGRLWAVFDENGKKYGEITQRTLTPIFLT